MALEEGCLLLDNWSILGDPGSVGVDVSVGGGFKALGQVAVGGEGAI